MFSAAATRPIEDLYVRARFRKTIMSMILLCCGFNPSVRGMQDREQENAAVQGNLADRPALFQGKTIDGWVAALKDPDPAVRKRAVEVLGERTLDPALPPDEKASLQTEVRSLAVTDKDAAVRQAAAFFDDLFKVSHSPEMVNRLLEQRRRASTRRGGRFAWSMPRADQSKVHWRAPIFSVTPTVTFPSSSPSRSNRRHRMLGACSR